ncbi:MAG: cytochrome c oxidase subunit 3 [Rhodospirillales bacterium]
MVEAEPVGPHQTPLREQFEALAQQREADTLGMWVFLGTEILFFGGLITSYMIYRSLFAPAFHIGSGHLDIASGTAMTVILLASSFTMALSVHAAEHGLRRRLILCLSLTLVLGLVFLGLKGREYYHVYLEKLVPGGRFQFAEPHAREVQLFMVHYFIMTGMHALHMIIGAVMVSVLISYAVRNTYRNYTMEICGLYWHFVDIVWLFLFPLLYLFELRTR